MPLAPPISFFFILWAEYHLVRSAEHKALRCVVFSISLSFFPLRAKCLHQHPILEPPVLCSFLSVSDRVSHPYKTKGRVTVLCILICVFLDSKLEDKRFCADWQQALPDCSLLLMFPLIEFWLVGVDSKYLNCYTFSKDCHLSLRCPFLLHAGNETLPYVTVEFRRLAQICDLWLLSSMNMSSASCSSRTYKCVGQ